MFSLPNFHVMQAALLRPMEPALRKLLSDRVANAVACGCEHLTHMIICEPGDREADFLREAAFSPFFKPLSGWRYGDTCFEPHWDWAGRHDGWFEWLTCVGNEGFAFIVLVPDVDGIDPPLLTMLREHIEAS